MVLLEIARQLRVRNVDPPEISPMLSAAFNLAYTLFNVSGQQWVRVSPERVPPLPLR